MDLTQSAKKRKAEDTRDPTAPARTVYSESSPGQNRRTRIAGRRASTKSKGSATLAVKQSLYQQAVEQINATYGKLCRDNAEQWKTLDLYSKIIFAASYNHQLAVFRGLYDRPVGQLMAMGSDELRQLGTCDPKLSIEDAAESSVPPTLCTVKTPKFVQVAAGGLHSVAVTDDGVPYSWGCNDDGALGRTTRGTPGDSDADAKSQATIKPVDEGFDSEDQGEIAMVECGDSHTLFLSLRGNVYMCGVYKDTDSGKFCELKPGSRNPVGSNMKPVMIRSFDQPVKLIACGLSFNAAILQDDSVVTWGMGHNGELARSADMTNATLDTETGKPTYDLGKSFYGEVYVSGQDEDGNPVEDFRFKTEVVIEHFLTPKPPRWAGPKIKRTVVSIACGGFHLLVAARDFGGLGTVLYTSGLNNYGQLGHGDTEARHELTPVKSLLNEQIVQMDGGEHFSIARDVRGFKVFTWGRSDYGQLGLYLTEQKAGSFESTPQRVPFPSHTKEEGLAFDQVIAGDRHAMVITRDKDIYSWGFGETGSTGQDIPGGFDARVPRKVDLMRNYRAKDSDSVIGNHIKVEHAAGGGQHSLLVVNRYM